MSNPVPERLINFRAYLEGNNLIGVADVELPTIELMSDTVSGAGIAGEVESPLIGHVASMTTKINFRTVTEKAMSLAAPKAHAIEFRGSQQIHDAGAGTYETVPVRVAMRAIPKNIELGKLEVGATTESGNEFEVTYLKIVVNNVDRIEIDKYNFKYVVDGVDYLARVRDDLGL
jgi:uncharacterized protein